MTRFPSPQAGEGVGAEDGQHAKDNEVGPPLEKALDGDGPGQAGDADQQLAPGTQVLPAKVKARPAGGDEAGEDDCPGRLPQPRPQERARKTEGGNPPRPEDEQGHRGDGDGRRNDHARDRKGGFARPAENLRQRQLAFDEKQNGEAGAKIARAELQDSGV